MTSIIITLLVIGVVALVVSGIPRNTYGPPPAPPDDEDDDVVKGDDQRLAG